MSEEEIKKTHELWTQTCETLEKQFADTSLLAHQVTRVPYEVIAAVMLRGAIAC